MSERFRSLEGILSSPPKRAPLRAVEADEEPSPREAETHDRGPTAPVSDEAADKVSGGASGGRNRQDSRQADQEVHADVPAAVKGRRASPSPAARARAPRPGEPSVESSPRSAAGALSSSGSSADSTLSPGTAPAGAADGVSQTTGGARRVAFRLAEDLHDAFAARVRAEGTSQAHVVLDAVEAAHARGDLDDLVAAERPPAAAGSLFTRPRTRGAATATVPTEIRVDAGTLDVLDQLVVQTGAESRTQLILAALREHLR